MDHPKFGPKCEELSELIENKASLKKIRQFLDQNPKLIEYLQKNEVFDSRDYYGWINVHPPLHIAAVYGKVNITRLLTVTYSFCIDARDVWENCSMTALHRAIYEKEPECVRLLLEQGANPNLGGKENGKEYENALALAERTEANKEIKTMLEKAIIGEREVEINTKSHLVNVQGQQIEQNTDLWGKHYTGTVPLA